MEIQSFQTFMLAFKLPSHTLLKKKKLVRVMIYHEVIKN